MTLLGAQDQQGSNEVGEDTWELFESIEQSFGVDLGDYYNLAGISIQELSQRIDGLAKYQVEDSCLSMVAFNKLRRAFQNVTETPRSAVHPATRISDQRWHHHHGFNCLDPARASCSNAVPRQGHTRKYRNGWRSRQGSHRTQLQELCQRAWQFPRTRCPPSSAASSCDSNMHQH